MRSSNSGSLIHQPLSEYTSDMELMSALNGTPPFEAYISPAALTNTPGGSPSSSSGLDLLWPNYPPGLPNLDLLRHLVEVFFVFHPHANRVLHYPSFMASLLLSPSHPRFPVPPILHAICALGSLYTSAVSSPPLPNFSEVAFDEIFTARHRQREGRPDSFAEAQSKYALESANQLESVGDRLFEVLQGKLASASLSINLTQCKARTILTWFYWSHSQYVISLLLLFTLIQYRARWLEVRDRT